MSRPRNASKTRLYDSKPSVFKGDVINFGRVEVSAESHEGFVSWSERGALVFRPGTYTIPKPINEMTQRELDACWTPQEPKRQRRRPTRPLTKRNRTRFKPRKRNQRTRP